MDINIKNPTYVALISREVPSDLARNLVLMHETIASLFAKTGAELALLGLSERNILAIKDSKRPSIPDKTLRQVLSDNWRTCCICHSTGEPIVVHHIEEWASSHSHAEKNLAVLCLKHHDDAHTKLGTSLKLPASEIREWKKKWIARVAILRRSFEKRVAETQHRSARWHWIHYDNLMRETIGMTPQIETSIPEDRLTPLREGNFINTSNALNPSDLWVEKLLKKKNYLFDSGCARLMGLYVSDMLGKFISQSSCLDISSFLDKPSIIKQYVRENALVFFRCRLEVEKRGRGIDFSGGAPRCQNTNETGLVEFSELVVERDVFADQLGGILSCGDGSVDGGGGAIS